MARFILGVKHDDRYCRMTVIREETDGAYLFKILGRNGTLTLRNPLDIG